jgi:uncharacterized tellurite resistance protein B-like protein
MSIFGMNDKKSHIAGLIKIAKSDGELSGHEVNVIKIIAIKMGISSTDFNDVVVNLDSISFIAPKTEEEKLKYLYDIFLVMKIDLEAKEEEHQICEELGMRLGFAVTDLERVAEYINKKLDHVVTIEEFKKVLSNN